MPLVLQILRRLLAAASLDERRCAFCRGVYSPQPSSDAPFCPVCRSLLEPRNQDSCPRCGQPLSVPAGPAPCGDCLTSPPPWRHFRFYAPYAGAFRSLLLRGKFGRDLAVLHLVGRLLARACADLPVPDAVVPVPLHPDRLRKRGFNQSQELARPLAGFLGAPLAPFLLRRPHPTRHQVGLSREERRANLHGAFRAHASVRGKTILLVVFPLTPGTPRRGAGLGFLAQGGPAVVVAGAARTPGVFPQSDSVRNPQVQPS